MNGETFNPYKGQGLGKFETTGMSPEERHMENSGRAKTIEDKITKETLSYAAEVAHAERTDMKHQYMVRQANAVKDLLKRVGGFENLTEDACETIVDNDIFYDRTIVFAIAQTLHKDTSLKH